MGLISPVNVPCGSSKEAGELIDLVILQLHELGSVELGGSNDLGKLLNIRNYLLGVTSWP